MPLPLYPIVAASLLVSVADKVPTFAIEPICRDAIVADKSTGRNAQDCLRDENAARTRLVQRWADYPAADRTRCTASTTAGIPSYVELLTCLQIARAARRLPKDDGLGAQGAHPKR